MSFLRRLMSVGRATFRDRRAMKVIFVPQLVKELTQQVKQYQSCGVQVLGVLGKNGSPTCGVEQTWNQDVTPGEGVFIEELKRGLLENNIELRLSGCRDADPEAALAIVDQWIP
jgi:hypothetical protein